MSPPPRFKLYSRQGCHLCELMLQDLGGMLGAGSYAVDIADVDADPVTRARWGHKIPVLLLGGELVCHGTLDADEVHKALAPGH